MAKEKATQIWKFTPSQTLLVQEQARIHANEHGPLQAYQARAQNDLLMQFKEELGIPEGVLLSVDLDTLQFTERQPTDQEATLSAPQLVEVPTVPDIYKDKPAAE